MVTFPFRTIKHLLEQANLINKKRLSEKTLQKISENLLVCSDHTTKQVLLYMTELEKQKIIDYMEKLKQPPGQT